MMTSQISLGCGWVMEEKCDEKLLLGDLGKIGCKSCSLIKLVEFILYVSKPFEYDFNQCRVKTDMWIHMWVWFQSVQGENGHMN